MFLKYAGQISISISATSTRHAPRREVHRADEALARLRGLEKEKRLNKTLGMSLSNLKPLATFQLPAAQAGPLTYCSCRGSFGSIALLAATLSILFGTCRTANAADESG